MPTPLNVALFLVATLLCACGRDSSNEQPSATFTTVYTTCYPVHFLTERLAGDAIDVELILPAGEDPIYWQPPREVLQELQSAALIVANGADFEHWMRSASLPPTRTVFSADTFAERHLTFADATHSHGPAGEHSHDGVDGHTWMDPRNAEDQALAITSALADAFPDEADAIRARMVGLRAELRDLDGRLRALDLGGVNLIAAHAAYNYLAERYGWSITNLDLDPTAVLDEEALDCVERAIDDSLVNVLLWESAPAPASAALLRERFGVLSAVYSPAESRPSSDENDFLAIQLANAARLAALAAE